MRPFQYIFTFFLMSLCYMSLLLGGIWSWAPVIFVFGFVPFLEIIPALAQDKVNPHKAREQDLLRKTIFDDMLVLAVVLHLGLIAMLMIKVSRASHLSDLYGSIAAVGLACGVYGINVGHELGHRVDGFSRFWARLTLYTSLYAHFNIEHNLGHHRNVATPDDPATARLGETVYAFWIRSTSKGYLSAWQINNRRLADRGISFWSLKNTMLIDQVGQLMVLLLIWFFLGGLVLSAFLLSALLGILLLETVNYIEHYGLLRQKTNGRYESVKHVHSWNSNHIIGRLLLFNLPRHSDHHARASRKYQILRHFDESPQLPAGYAAMVLLALLPPALVSYNGLALPAFRTWANRGWADRGLLAARLAGVINWQFLCSGSCRETPSCNLK